MARGGRRAGAPGVSYGQRTDLNRARTLPAVAPTGLPYGEHQQLVAQQQQIPLPRAPQPPAPAPAPPPGPATQPPPAPAFTPGQWGPLDRPSERPHEPITAGMPFGPGPGPEALAPAPLTRPISSVIDAAAAASGNAELAALAQHARNQGQ